MITSFKEDLSFDEEKYREFIRFQINSSYHILTMGTKGENATMSHEELYLAIVEFSKMMLNNEWNKERNMQLELSDLFKILFIEINPSPVKYAAEVRGLMNRRMRLPLKPPLEENQTKIRYILQTLNLI